MSNTTFGTGNVINAPTTNSLAEGQNNTINNGNAHHAEGVSNTIDAGEANHVEGIDNTILSGFNNHVEGANHLVEGFESHVQGTANRTTSVRAGQSISGFAGYFLYNPTVSFISDTFNYSNQLAGGIDGGNANPGEGISIVDRTLINGVYPIGQHQAYRNTADGLNYAVMLKGKQGLSVGHFVTFSCKKDYTCERLIDKAECTNDVIGVITEASGFIANAGQFAASERIVYDDYKSPLYTTNTTFPALRTIIKPGVDRTVRFVPFDERSDYYAVALSGLVVVKAKFDKCDKHYLKCNVKNGKAIPGDTYFIIQYIDKEHLLILLK